METELTGFQTEIVSALRELTLQLMFMAAGVFGIVGGFVGTSEKAFRSGRVLVLGLTSFALSALAGYATLGAIISLLDYKKVDPWNGVVLWGGLFQIILFVLGGLLFVVFVSRNLGDAKRRVRVVRPSVRRLRHRRPDRW